MITIVDTNVPVTANGYSGQASSACVYACILRLETLTESGKIVLDTQWQVLHEYQANLDASGQSGPGDRFLHWVLRNRGNPECCKQYSIDEIEGERGFRQFPDDPALSTFDPADRKFAALAVVSGAPVWNAVDPGWWEYREALQRNGIQVEFLCPDFIAAEN